MILAGSYFFFAWGVFPEGLGLSAMGPALGRREKIPFRFDLNSVAGEEPCGDGRFSLRPDPDCPFHPP